MTLMTLIRMLTTAVVVMGFSFTCSHAQLSRVLPESTLLINDISFATRALWIRQANEAVKKVTYTPCPFAAFGTVIVNHSKPDPGELVCTGGNLGSHTGNPSLHGTRQLIRSTALLNITQSV